jgi:hypothetical protein
VLEVSSETHRVQCKTFNHTNIIKNRTRPKAVEEGGVLEADVATVVHIESVEGHMNLFIDGPLGRYESRE